MKKVMYRSLSIVILILLAFPVAAEEINAGFIQGLWYAHEPLIAGEPTRIYVALRNNSEDDLTGSVRFTDNGNRIGVAYVSALPGRIVEAWVDWTPGYGEHNVSASLTNVQIHPIGETPETGEVVNTVAQNAVFVDRDTDQDGVPNEKDPDDDNDGVSDAAETTRGTDPLKANPQPTTEKPQPTPKETLTTDTTSYSSSTKEREGLEQYVPEGRAQDMLSSLTDSIESKKASLDAYREERNDKLEEYFNTSSTTTVTADEATITRSRNDKEGSFFVAVMNGGKALMSGIYSLLLSLLSAVFAFPALIELLLLLITVYLIYRTARRFGRRRT